MDIKYYANSNKSNNEMYHWGLDKGEKAKGHKYIARVGTSPNYKYFYTLSSYNSYLKGKVKTGVTKATNSVTSTVKKATSSVASTTKKTTTSLTTKTSSTTEKIAKIASTKLSSLYKKASTTVNTVAKKASTTANTVAKKASTTANTVAKKASTTANTVAKKASTTANTVAKKASTTANTVAKKASTAISKLSTTLQKNIEKRVTKLETAVKSKVAETAASKTYHTNVAKEISKNIKMAAKTIKSSASKLSKKVSEISSNSVKTVEKMLSSNTKSLGKIGKVNINVKPVNTKTTKADFGSSEINWYTYSDGTQKKVKTDKKTGETEVTYSKNGKTIDTPDWDKDGYKSDSIGTILLKAVYNIIDSLPNGDKLTNKLFPELSKQDKDKYPDPVEIKPGAEKIEQYINKVDHNEDVDERLANVNPNWGDSGYTENCTLCTLAYDLRNRGYDVEAGSSYGESTETIAYFYEDPKAIYTQFLNNYSKDKSYSKLSFEEYCEETKKEMISYGEGAGGHAVFVWSYADYSHDAYWEVENGEVMIRDGQSGETFPIEVYWNESSSFTWARTDDQSLSIEAIYYTNSPGTTNTVEYTITNQAYQNGELTYEEASELKAELYAEVIKHSSKNLY